MPRGGRVSSGRGLRGGDDRVDNQCADVRYSRGRYAGKDGKNPERDAERPAGCPDKLNRVTTVKKNPAKAARNVGFDLGMRQGCTRQVARTGKLNWDISMCGP